MDTLDCGHVAVAGPRRLCRHLFGVPEDRGVGYVRCLTGRGMRYNLRCVACADCDAAVFEVCEGCVDRAETDHYTDGWRGRPGIGRRPEPCDPTLVATPLPPGFADAADVVEVAAVPARAGVWLVLARDGRVGWWDVGAGVCRVVVSAGSVLGGVEGEGRGWVVPEGVVPALRVSASGRFVAVVEDFGRRGAVFDLGADGDAGAGIVVSEPTLLVDGGGYQQDTVPLSFAFVEWAGRTVAVHRTCWNRLDVADAATGELLTGRVLAEPSGGRVHEIERYLNYFHGALFPSPDGSWLLDDGWVWHPFGAPAVWSVHRWLSDNPYESEDGSTLSRLTTRAYRWNNPCCWFDDRHVAIGGIGDDDESMLDGVEMYDAWTGARVGMFAGPVGRLFSDGRRLYSAGSGYGAGSAGLEVWDPWTGERTGSVPGIVPTHHHAGSRELAEFRDGVLLRWSMT